LYNARDVEKSILCKHCFYGNLSIELMYSREYEFPNATKPRVVLNIDF
jgi:hypothetical protein